jgi:hypothetical protein
MQYDADRILNSQYKKTGYHGKQFYIADQEVGRNGLITLLQKEKELFLIQLE